MEAITTEREEALGAIIAAYNQVTDRLKDAHERLQLEVRRLREELEHKNVELQRSERLAALGEMAAGLAHEVRNPLGGIALQASMLERDVADRPRCEAAARQIREGVRALDRLVTDVLGFAQEGSLEMSCVSLDVLIDRICSQCVVPGAATVSIDVGAVRTWADAARLERVLVNLVRNALQAAGAGGIVGIVTRDGAEGGVEIEINDTGPGIAPEHLERIFNPFFTTKAEGTGLGLAIVHRIVEAHRGRITVRSVVGRGATFVIWIPGKSG